MSVALYVSIVPYIPMPGPSRWLVTGEKGPGVRLISGGQLQLMLQLSVGDKDQLELVSGERQERPVSSLCRVPRWAGFLGSSGTASGRTENRFHVELLLTHLGMDPCF
ncbi:unnamed protein product [Boreogadus saida]